MQAQADAGVAFAIEALHKAPQDYNEFYWWAFSELASERSVGMSIGPIPHSKILAFCDEHGLFGYERFTFQYCMRGLDNAQLKIIRKRSEEASKAKTAKR